MTFKDVFSSSFLEKVTGFSAGDMIIALALSFALGLYIFYIYKKTYSGVMYSSGFGVALLAMTLITTFIILAITSNVVLSLGMVGALSIVRFRAAVKEPLDIAYIFWAIAAGIVLGAGLIPLAVFGSVFIGIILLIFANKRPSDSPYVLIVNCAGQEAEDRVNAFLDTKMKKRALKSKTVSSHGTEIIVEVRLKGMESGFVNEIAGMEGVSNAVLVSYNGDYMA